MRSENSGNAQGINASITVVVALEFDCLSCGQRTPSGVITDKQALRVARKIRVRCKHCSAEFHVNTRDIKLDDDEAEDCLG